MADRRAGAVAALARKLGHDFRDPSLLDQALTHASVGEGAERDARGRPFLDNQRMEFLGDRVLGLLVAERLMRDLPNADEGEMSSRGSLNTTMSPRSGSWARMRPSNSGGLNGMACFE